MSDDLKLADEAAAWLKDCEHDGIDPDVLRRLEQAVRELVAHGDKHMAVINDVDAQLNKAVTARDEARAEVKSLLEDLDGHRTCKEFKRDQLQEDLDEARAEIERLLQSRINAQGGRGSDSWAENERMKKALEEIWNYPNDGKHHPQECELWKDLDGDGDCTCGYWSVSFPQLKLMAREALKPAQPPEGDPAGPDLGEVCAGTKRK
jgi:hypothetical protein